MNYDQLKALSWWQLMELLERTAKAYRNVPAIGMPDLALHLAQLPAPTLCLLGDFEIRARFYETLEGRPVCGKCGKTMTPENSRVSPELFLCDACVDPTPIKVADPIAFFQPGKQTVTRAEYDCLHDRYRELLNAVARKWPGETCHQTALRYIREVEARAIQGPVCEDKTQAPEGYHEATDPFGPAPKFVVPGGEGRLFEKDPT